MEDRLLKRKYEREGRNDSQKAFDFIKKLEKQFINEKNKKIYNSYIPTYNAYIDKYRERGNEAKDRIDRKKNRNIQKADYHGHYYNYGYYMNFKTKKLRKKVKRK